MEWFTGSIPEAIQASKVNKGLFVVVIVDADDDHALSKTLLGVLDEDDVRSRLSQTSTPSVVAIKLVSGSESFKQFTQIYPVLLLPSVYFIDSSTGVDIEVTGGPVDKEKIVASIDKAVSKLQASQPSASIVATVNPCDVASPRGQRVDEARRVLEEAVPTSSVTSTQSTETNPQSSTSGLSLEERVARAKELLAERQAQKAREEAEIEKSKEQERRELGKTLSEMKRQREEEEMIKAAEERRKDKEEEKIAREKIRAQIAQDRAERAARFDAAKQAEAEAKAERERQKREQEATEAQRLAAERCNNARVQLRFPDGRSKTKVLSATAKLQEVYDFANEEVASAFGRDNFSLSISYPARQLDQDSRDAPLRDVGLVPSGTVLVLPRGSSGSFGALAPSTGSILSYLWILLTPISFLWSLVRSFFSSQPTTSAAATNDPRSLRAGAAEKRQQAQDGNPDQSKRPTTAYRRRTPATSGIRREGNIARLGAEEDSDDESNTYNGNSTQQM